MTEASRRILIADDETQVRQAFVDALKPTKGKTAPLDALEQELFGGTAAAKPRPLYDLTAVAQGVDAIEAVRAAVAEGKTYAIVFLDMRMPPGIDGLQTAKAIRALDRVVNIVLVTGYSDVDVSVVAADVLPPDKFFYIAKPFQVAEIRQQAAALSARWDYESELVRELKAQNAQLSVAREDAVRATLAKSHFLSNVSHELRTPLNAIIGFSDILAGEAYGMHTEPRYLDYSREINASGKGLLGAINDIIDTARLDIGKLALSFEEVDAADVLKRAAQELSSRALRGAVTLTVHASGPTPIPGDARRLHQILFSILHNAVKFAPSGGKVDASSVITGDNVIVTISDNGPGMSAELVEMVQRPFAQGDNEHARHNTGLGLGLSLAKRLVELHQGCLRIESAAGRGTTVHLAFPAWVAPAQEQSPAA